MNASAIDLLSSVFAGGQPRGSSAHAPPALDFSAQLDQESSALSLEEIGEEIMERLEELSPEVAEVLAPLVAHRVAAAQVDGRLAPTIVAGLEDLLANSGLQIDDIQLLGELEMLMKSLEQSLAAMSGQTASELPVSEFTELAPIVFGMLEQLAGGSEQASDQLKVVIEQVEAASPQDAAGSLFRAIKEAFAAIREALGRFVSESRSGGQTTPVSAPLANTGSDGVSPVALRAFLTLSTVGGGAGVLSEETGGDATPSENGEQALRLQVALAAGVRNVPEAQPVAPGGVTSVESAGEADGSRFDPIAVVQRAMATARLARDSGPMRVSMQLDPPHLGLLRMSVIVRGSNVITDMVTETQGARSLILAHASQLRVGLADQGFRLESFNVNVQSHLPNAAGDGGGQGWTPQGSSSQGQGSFAELMEPFGESSEGFGVRPFSAPNQVLNVVA